MIAHGEVVDAGIVVLTVKFVNIFHLPRVEKTLLRLYRENCRCRERFARDVLY